MKGKILHRLPRPRPSGQTFRNAIYLRQLTSL